jgi:uncharacterized membrane protein YkoI
MIRLLTTAALVAGLSLAGGSLAAQSTQDTGVTRNVPDSLVSQAKVNEDSARAVALKRVPGTVQSVTLERERHRLMWEFKIQRQGRKSASEVEVNASTGKVIRVEAATRTRARSTTRHSS